MIAFELQTVLSVFRETLIPEDLVAWSWGENKIGFGLYVLPI
jgi:hypothetical protein